MKKSTQPSRLLQGLLSGAALISLSVGLSGISTDAQAGVSATKHNLGSGTMTNDPRFNKLDASGSAEVCVFCHTPHGADTSAAGLPLWNKKLGTGNSYTTYVQTSTLDATNNLGPQGSISLACLSCHDGSQAMDNQINGAGYGNYYSDGGAANGQDFVWATSGVATTNLRDSTGKLTQFGTSASLIGQDLSNDHPIGIEYCGGFTTSGDVNTCRDIDFKTPTKIGTGSTAKYYVETSQAGVSTIRDKTDMILYTRDFGGAASFAPSVECTSCHDPHVEPKASTQVAFLRVSQANSGLCLSCHVK